MHDLMQLTPHSQTSSPCCTECMEHGTRCQDQTETTEASNKPLTEMTEPNEGEVAGAVNEAAKNQVW